MVCSLRSPGSVTTNAPGARLRSSSQLGQRRAHDLGAAVAAVGVTGRAGCVDGRHAVALERPRRRPRASASAVAVPAEPARRARTAPAERGPAAPGRSSSARAAPRRSRRGRARRPARRTRRRRTAVRSPPTAAATTGVPHACASIATSPNDSLYDGTTTTSAARYQSASSACATGGTNRTTSAMPSRAASSCSASGRSRPVPDGPPTTGDDEPLAQRRVALRAAGAAARSSTSGALSGWMRPTNSSTSASRGDAEPRAGVGRPPGRKTSRSTPGCTTRDPLGVGVVELDQLLGPPRRCWRSSRSAAATTCSSPITAADRLGGVARRRARRS